MKNQPDLSLQQELQELLVQSVSDYAIYAIDADGVITTWNPGAQKLKGYTAEEIVGEHLSRFYTQEDRQAGRPAKLMAQAAAEGRVEDEGWRVRKDGSKFWALVVISAIRDKEGRLIGFGKVTRDLTERRRAEENRLRLAQLHEAARVRDQFLAYVSHEMRTPLAAMQLQLELLRESTSFAGEKAFERLNRSYKRLAELVDSVLEHSRTQAGRAILDPEWTDLNQLAQDVVSEFRPEAQHKGLALILSPTANSCPVYTDVNAVRVILRNLTANAIKFANRGTIQIAITANEFECRIAVKDEGVGIPPEHQERIFEPFERIEPLANKHIPGFGLGLATSRRLSEALGGRIELESAVSEGSTFTLVLPNSPAES